MSWPGVPRSWSARGGALVAAAVLAALGWIGVRGILAWRHLDAARAGLTTLERQLLAGDVPSDAVLRARVARIRAQTRAARGLTGDPIWSLAGATPWVGCPLRSAAGLVRAVDDVSARGVPPLATVGAALRPAALRTGADIHLAAFAHLDAPLAAAGADLRTVRPRIQRVSGCGWLGRRAGLAAARTTLLDDTGTLLGRVGDADLAVKLAPAMLGGAGPRRYLLIVTNDAESRADGGIVGGFGLLTATRGRLELTDISGNSALPGGQTQQLPAEPLPAALAPLYGAFEPTRVWANANLTPDYPTANGFYTALYRAGTGVAVDGTITVDPTALSYLVAATRPAVLPGGTLVRAADLVRLVESTVYARIGDTGARERFFAGVGRAAYQAVTSGGGSTANVLRALGRSAGEGRLLIASNHPDEQRLLATTPVGGALPTARGPFLAVITQNAAASKLDYWLRRQTDYQFTRRPDGSADVIITVRITNAAPAGLPAYVRLRADQNVTPGVTNAAELNAKAQNRLWLSVYTGAGSGFVGAELDGRPVQLASATEGAHPVASTYLSVDRGATDTLVLRVWEPPSVAGPLVVRPQPLVAPEKFTVTGIGWTTAGRANAAD